MKIKSERILIREWSQAKTKNAGSEKFVFWAHGTSPQMNGSPKSHLMHLFPCALSMLHIHIKLMTSTDIASWCTIPSLIHAHSWIKTILYQGSILCHTLHMNSFILAYPVMDESFCLGNGKSASSFRCSRHKWQKPSKRRVAVKDVTKKASQCFSKFWKGKWRTHCWIIVHWFHSSLGCLVGTSSVA